MRNLAYLILGSLALVACGSGNQGTFQTEDGEVAYDAEQSDDETKVTVTTGDGSTVETNSGSGTAEWPEGFSLYPGAAVISSMQVNATDGGGTMILIQSSATPEELAAFYRRLAEAAGITIATNARVNGNVTLNGEGADGRTFSFSASSHGDGTTGQLIVGRGQ